MIPSRGVVRVFPSGVPKVSSTGRLTARTFATRTPRGSRATPHNAGLMSSSGSRATLFATGPRAAPIALGTVASARNLSLWGWGGSKNNQAAEEASKAAEAAKEQAQHAASSATDAATDNVSAAPPLTEPTVTPTEIDTNGIMEMITGQDILSMNSEQIGYLASLGINPSLPWPSGVMVPLLEHIHVYTGLGWAGSIIGTALALRLIMTPLHIWSLQNGARMAKMQADPRAAEMIKLRKEAWELTDQTERQQNGQKASFISKKLKKEYQVNNWAMLGGILQIPFTIGLFNTIRNMTAVPVPGMETAGFLWFADLTVRDPYFILPVTATALLVGSMTITQKYMAPAQAKTMKKMLWGVGGIGFLFSTFFSAGINLMGTAFGAFTLLTNMVLEIPSLRRKLGLAMGPPGVAGAAPAGPAIPVNASTIKYEAPRGAAAAPAPEPVPEPKSMKDRMLGGMAENMQAMSKQMNQMGSFGGRLAATESERAEKKRKEMMVKLEKTRKTQEREEFEKKYKKGN